MPEQKLPDGKTCKDCAHYYLCLWNYAIYSDSVTCPFDLFKEKKHEDPVPSARP
jgi:hypothetical protein